MKKTDLAWAAGFVDGEGSFGWEPRAGLIRFVVPQVDRRNLRRLKRLFGFGYLNGPYVRKRKDHSGYKSKPISYFGVYSLERVHVVAKLLWPWLGPAKRAQVKATLKAAVINCVKHKGVKHGCRKYHI